MAVMAGLPPSEFWNMSVTEFWWWYEAKTELHQIKTVGLSNNDVDECAELLKNGG